MTLSRFAILAGAAALSFTPAAFAQQATTGATAPALMEIEDDAAMIQSLNITVDQIEDMDVYDAGGQEIGEVEEVLGTSDGQASAVAVEVGGFLGIGEKDVVVNLDDLTQANDQLVLDMTKEQVEALPAWDD